MASLFFVMAIGACELPSDRVMDVISLMGRSPEEIKEQIGQPDTTYFTYVLNKKIFTQRYHTDSYEVELFYPKGFLEEVLVNHPMPLPFDKQSLEKFGVVVEKSPKENIDHVMMTWVDAANLSRISIYSIHRDSAGMPDDYRFYFKKNIKIPSP